MEKKSPEMVEWLGEMLDAGALVALAALAQVAQEREQGQAQEPAPQGEEVAHV